MTPEVAQLLASGYTIGLGVIGPAIGIGMIVAKSVEAISRNPEMINDIRSTMILGIAFTESLAIFALIITLIIKFVG